MLVLWPSLGQFDSNGSLAAIQETAGGTWPLNAR